MSNYEDKKESYMFKSSVKRSIKLEKEVPIKKLHPFNGEELEEEEDDQASLEQPFHIPPPNEESYGFLSTTAREGQWLNTDNPFKKTYKENRAQTSNA